MKSRTSARLWALAKLAVAALLLYLIISYTDGFEALGERLFALSPAMVLLALAVLTADRVLMAYKWVLLLRATGPALSVLKATQLYCASMVWGLFLPTTIGADAVRIASSVRQGLPAGRLTASVLIERVVGSLASLLASVLGGFLIAGLVSSGNFRQIMWLGVVGLLLGTALFAFSMHLASEGRPAAAVIPAGEDAR